MSNARETGQIVAAIGRVEKTLDDGITATVTAGDLEIGAVEIKNSITDDRAIVNASGELLVKDTTADTSLSVIDDWDETDRAKVNIIAGQAGIAAGTGVDGVTVPRVTLATNIALPAGTNNIGDVDVLSSALPAGASTSALQTTGNTALSAIQTSVELIDNTVSGTELQVDVVASLPAGTNAIGKLVANSGVDIGDVDVLSIAAGDNNIGNVDVLSVIPGTGATNSGKAVDSASGATDTGSAILAVRDDALGALTPVEGDYVSLRTDANGALWTHDDALDAALAGSELQIDIVGSLPAGSANIGDVDIASIAAGTNLIGKVSIDQVTANANEVVLKAGSAIVGSVTGDVADNAVQVNLKPLYGGGKAIDIATYSPAYTANDAAGLAVNKDNGGLLVHQANLSSTDDSVSAIPGETTKTTYSCSFTALIGAAAATDIVEIIGSATKTVRVKKIKISGVATAAAAVDLLLIKRSAAATGGTSTSATIVPMDSNNAAGTAVVKGYTVNPTVGTAVGTIESHKPTLTTAAGAIPNVPLVIEFGDNGNQNVILRGAAQTLCINLNGATITGNSLNVTVLFTEE